MRSRNHYVYGTPERLNELAEEYKEYCGREVRVEEGRLCVLALPTQRKKKEKKGAKGKRTQRSDSDSGN